MSKFITSLSPPLLISTNISDYVPTDRYVLNSERKSKAITIVATRLINAPDAVGSVRSVGSFRYTSNFFIWFVTVSLNIL